ncbi:histidine--tRNA ligase [Candidatus Kaiserbacteria bacterium]|nr:histidine--tRNA ligase [Candidatus Kaiserbacteria bacterium]
MKNNKLSTDSYKGVRDFFPEDMAIQEYIFETWSHTAESFGFSRYDASVLEPSAIYKAKGAENEEMVNEQTYSFVDRGNREVTLRPEMTPTVARMIAAKRRDLTFPVRWYSIPNLFRYERAQRGRLREHWQLNCDIFGADDYTADIEIIALAYQVLVNFGATEDMFEILVNNRQTMKKAYEMLGITNADTVTAITRLNDRKDKIEPTEYLKSLTEIVNDESLAKEIKKMIESSDPGDSVVVAGLKEMGINNVRIDRSLARGFDYYTGTIFEIKDTNPDNNRSLLGGGRYDNLTAMFGGEAVSGIGFGMGDVTMRDFLETHDLLTSNIPAPTLMIMPLDKKLNLPAQILAKQFRDAGLSVATDMSDKKIGKKLANAGEQFVDFALILGDNEYKNKQYQVKNLTDQTETSGTLDELIEFLTQ